MFGDLPKSTEFDLQNPSSTLHSFSIFELGIENVKSSAAKALGCDLDFNFTIRILFNYLVSMHAFLVTI